MAEASLDMDAFARLDCVRKFDRAKQHLVEIEALINEYRASNPYAVGVSIEGKRKRRVWKLHVIEPPPARISLLLGDFLYNTRSALDYLAADLLLKGSDRSHSFFPILSERIWEVPVSDADDGQRKRLRRRWAFVERAFPPEVIQKFKDLQPPNGRGNPDEPANFLAVLNALSNEDRHRNLHVVSGLSAASLVMTATRQNGRVGTVRRLPRGVVENGAILRVPGDVVDVKIEGTVEVIVKAGPDQRYAAIPQDMDAIWRHVASILIRFAPLLLAKPVEEGAHD